jgi:hypothetical protein
MRSVNCDESIWGPKERLWLTAAFEIPSFRILAGTFDCMALIGLMRTYFVA